MSETAIVHNLQMTQSIAPEVETICPVSGQPMVLLHVIRRAFAEHANVLRC